MSAFPPPLGLAVVWQEGLNSEVGQRGEARLSNLTTGCNLARCSAAGCNLTGEVK